MYCKISPVKTGKTIREMSQEEIKIILQWHPDRSSSCFHGYTFGAGCPHCEALKQKLKEV